MIQERKRKERKRDREREGREREKIKLSLILSKASPSLPFFLVCGKSVREGPHTMYLNM